MMRSYRGYRTAWEVRSEYVEQDGRVNSVNRLERETMSDHPFLDMPDDRLPGNELTEIERREIEIAGRPEREAKANASLIAEAESGSGVFADRDVEVTPEGRLILKIPLKRAHYEWLVDCCKNVFKDRTPENMVERLVRAAYGADPTKGGTLTGSLTFLSETAEIIEPN